MPDQHEFLHIPTISGTFPPPHTPPLTLDSCKRKWMGQQPSWITFNAGREVDEGTIPNAHHPQEISGLNKPFPCPRKLVNGW